MRLILFGPPGVGKGTQAKDLAGELNLSHISCGDLLRQAVKDKTPLGRKAEDFMRKGELVPDNLVTQLVIDRIKQPDAEKGFILDGYPRNISQAIELDNILKNSQHEIDAALYLEANQEVIIQRLTGRRLCLKCQANYHIKNMPPKNEGICDYCGGKLYQRTDDNKETIETRLKIYKDSTVSLIEYYRKKNKILHIIANEEAEVVLRRILIALNTICPADNKV